MIDFLSSIIHSKFFWFIFGFYFGVLLISMAKVSKDNDEFYNYFLNKLQNK